MKMENIRLVVGVGLLLGVCVSAKPYPDPKKVPGVAVTPEIKALKILSPKNNPGLPCWRFLVDWKGEGSESFELVSVTKESSCTPAFFKRARKKPHLGSYLGLIKSQKTGEVLFYDSIGTGKEFRKLVSEIHFRFPVPNEIVIFELHAENPRSGVLEKVYEKSFSGVDREASVRGDVLVKELRPAKTSTPLYVNVYAEGYMANDQEKFFKDAQKIVATFEQAKFPGQENFHFYAIFGPSNKKLGRATNLGLPIPERDSFLGLYYPYTWTQGRWHHIVYPTRENKFREALAQWPYDYPIALVDSSSYWGVGNYKELTAIPSDNFSFRYLLLHEFGHFMGLNEEYQGGGPTELEFAVGIKEPWSQNITFQKELENIKWKTLVDPTTPIPTPQSVWNSRTRPYGAYVGGYADSGLPKQSHIPGLGCTMSNGATFCDVCSHALKDLVAFDSQ